MGVLSSGHLQTKPWSQRWAFLCENVKILRLRMTYDLAFMCNCLICGLEEGPDTISDVRIDARFVLLRVFFPK